MTGPWTELFRNLGADLADIDPRIGVTPTGLVLPDDLSEDQWQRLGTVLNTYGPLLDPEFVKHMKKAKPMKEATTQSAADDKVRERKPPRPGSRKAAVYERYLEKGETAACNLAMELGLKIGTAHSWCNEWSKN